MIPKGIFAIGAGRPGTAEHELDTIRRRLSEGESIDYQISNDGRCVLGVVRSDLYPYPAVVSTEEEQHSIGVFDGFTYEDSFVEREPHRLCGMTIDDVSMEANGMFLAASYGDGVLSVLTDPWATLPLYCSTHEDKVLFSTSLAILRNSSDQYSDIFVGGGGDISASQFWGHS